MPIKFIEFALIFFIKKIIINNVEILSKLVTGVNIANQAIFSTVSNSFNEIRRIVSIRITNIILL